MITVIAEIRTRPGQHHRQAVLDQFAKIVPTVLKEEGCHGYAPMVDCAAGVSFQSMAPDSIVMIEQWESIAHLEDVYKRQISSSGSSVVFGWSINAIAA